MCSAIISDVAGCVRTPAEILVRYAWSAWHAMSGDILRGSTPQAWTETAPMIAIVTRYQRKPGTREEASALLDTMRDEIMALPGMIQFNNVMHADGSGYLISLVESEAQANMHTAKSAAIWARFAQFVESWPAAETFDVAQHWVGQAPDADTRDP